MSKMRRFPDQRDLWMSRRPSLLQKRVKMTVEVTVKSTTGGPKIFLEAASGRDIKK